MRVCVDRYGFLPVDKAAFKGEIPDIPNLVPAVPFDFYIKRKLYVHNMGHSICAYLGGFNGRKYIWQAIDDPDILHIVQNAMLDSATALSKKYGISLDEILPHITDLLGRFRNQSLGDTCQRVGADPVRKLGPDVRLVGSALLCIEQGITPVYTALGAAGAIYRYLNETDMEQTVDNAHSALCKISRLKQDHPLAMLVLELYETFRNGDTPSTMRRTVQNMKSSNLPDVI